MDANKAPRVSIASRQVLADHIYDAVLDLLIDGELGAGDVIGIDALAREFQVSSTPVREALARLESTGLVRRTALKGYRVAPMTTPDELDHLMQARLLLEPSLAELAATRLDDQITARLEGAVHDLATAPLGPSFHDFRAYWQADERFHRIVAEATGNEFLVAAYTAIGGQIQRFRLFGGMRGVTDADHCVAEHTRVLEGLRSRDPARARAAMAAHLTDARDRALASYTTHPPSST
ncbi:GntR family transcriptional regulator [uncultured Pseudokineococcus sp.]|uniref:GntR family transcriptional regulator n=1 Tax=uncultured Pseudokineococcus sp. TaxID=1642928 RepID=UPI00262B79A4|nr:GntR family transcriptional regulator [uncultured Pseudokineococcus sp.]